MNADLQHFGQITEAPDAMPRLRQFVLDLAARGRLVPQDPADEPASCPGLSGADEVVGLPAGWRSGSFGTVFTLEYGDNLPAAKRSNTGEFPVYGSNGVVGTHSQASVDRPCILVGRKGSAGALNLCLASGCWVTDVAYFCVPPEGIDLEFAFLLFHTLGLQTLGKGVKPGLSRGDAASLSVNIPPLPEQHRIVAKVEELMALCDQLEAAGAKREMSRNDLVVSSLYRLAPPMGDGENSGPEQLRRSAEFTLANMATVTGRAEHVEQLRYALLSLAVEGRLVSQEPADEPASEHMKRIRSAMASAIEQGLVKPAKAASGPLDGEHTAIPDGWMRVRLADLVTVVNGRAYAKDELLESGPTPVLRVGNLFTSDCWYYSGLSLGPEKYCDAGDLLYAWSASFGPFIWNGPRAIFHYHIWNIRLHSEQDTSKRFLYYWLLSKTKQIKAAGHGVSMAHMTKAKMEQLVVDIPPRAEQDRIVQRVDELMLLCDELLTRLSSEVADRTLLLEALLDHALLRMA